MTTCDSLNLLILSSRFFNVFWYFIFSVLCLCAFSMPLWRNEQESEAHADPIDYAVTVTPDVVKFGGRCVVCCFRVNGGHGTDGRTDGRDITRNVASMGRTAKYRNKYSFIV